MGRFAAAVAFCIAGCTAVKSPTVVREAPPDQRAKAQALEPFMEPCLLDAAAEPRPFGAHEHATPAPVPSVFLDVAVFTAPHATRFDALAGWSQSLVEDPEVELITTTQFSVELGRPSRWVVEERSGPLTRPVVHALSALPTLADGDYVALDLEVVLQLPGAPLSQDAFVTRTRRLSFATAPRLRRPVAMFGPIPELPGRSLLLLLTAYLVRDDRDLRSIFLCKLWHRQRATENTVPR
jgi:hypothetical protein